MRQLALPLSILCTLGLSACDPDTKASTDDAKKAPAPGKVEATPEAKPETKPEKSAQTSACVADPKWISNPTMPTEVAAAESFCDFYQFSWQWFLAEMQPADASNPNGERWFEANNRIYIPGETNQCAQTDGRTGRAASVKAFQVRDGKEDEFEDGQADGQPLYDQNGNVLYYSIYYSPEECQATSAGFVAKTVEIKAAWKVLDAADPTYFTIPATVPVVDGTGKSSSKDVTLGLVGFHLVNWTSKHPEFIWATFEHKSNAPLCSGSSPSPAAGWTLASAKAAECLTANPSPNGSISDACKSFEFNAQPGATKQGDLFPTTGDPNNVCQLFEWGTDSGTAANGNDNAANRQAIVDLNDQLVGPKGLLTALPDGDAMKVWSNYQMVGGLWTKDGAASGSPPVPSAQGPANPNSPQRGSLELANTTMETYEQGPTSPIPNCFGCHNFDPASPLKVSHIASSLLPSGS